MSLASSTEIPFHHDAEFDNFSRSRVAQLTASSTPSLTATLSSNIASLDASESTSSSSSTSENNDNNNNYNNDNDNDRNNNRKSQTADLAQLWVDLQVPIFSSLLLFVCVEFCFSKFRRSCFVD